MSLRVSMLEPKYRSLRRLIDKCKLEMTKGLLRFISEALSNSI